MAKVWIELQELWDEVSFNVHKMDITEARKKWIIPFFRTLGFSPVYQPQDIITSGDDRLKFHISHRGFPQERDPMIHTVSPSDDLDVRNASDRNKKSPHDTLQIYLNVEKKAQWGLLTNGIVLRLLRDFYHTSTKGYVEFDLQNIFTDRSFSDFRALYRMLHASRFSKDKEGIIPLEHFFNESRAAGVKVGEDLQGNVKRAIETLGNGFLTGELAQRMISDEKFCHEYYEELLHVIYRILFLLFAEQRGMLPSRDSLYAEEYSITKLRELSETSKGKDKHADLWYGLKVTFRLLKIGSPKLRVFPYNGSLFDDERIKILSSHSCTNENLLIALKYLTLIEKDRVSQRISYLDLGVEEIGSIYESLLEFTPRVLAQNETIEGEFVNARTFFLDPRGTARKTTGSYYTNPLLVDELIKSALIPVVQKKIAAGKTPIEMANLLLALRICDLSCGSAAFLIAAVNYMGRELAKIRTGTDYPSDKEERRAKRDVLQHCIYGVDLNPMAVELAKVSLWINCAVEDMPLNFLDHHIKCGNSLIGTTPDLLLKGIPDEAFTPVEGDDKTIAKEVVKINKNQKNSQSLAAWVTHEEEKIDTERFNKLSDLPEDKPEGVAKKEDCYNQLMKSYSYSHQKLLADAWTSAFFWSLTKETKDAPTQGVLRLLHEGDSGAVDKKIIDRVKALAQEYRFFHWYLEFPEVFQREDAGFDCVIGNPPWEKIQPEEVKFFSHLAPQISDETDAKKRKNMIENLRESNSNLFALWVVYKQNIEFQSKFLSKSNLYALSAKGNLNLYRLFADLARMMIRTSGKSGLIVQSGIATDDLGKEFFNELMTKRQIESLYDFENKEGIFDIHRSTKFSLITLTQSPSPKIPEFSYFLQNVDEIQDNNKKFTISYEDLELINPNTKNCPMFRCKNDAEILKRIHINSSILLRENDTKNIWELDIWGEMFNMTRAEKFSRLHLENQNFFLDSKNYFISRDSNKFVPLYESKLIHSYDHRYGTFQDVNNEERIKGNARRFDLNEKIDLNQFIETRYWVKEKDFLNRLKGRGISTLWFLGMRSIARATDERTSIASIIPCVGIGNSLNLLLLKDAKIACLLLANINTFICDFASRQKVGNQNLNIYIIKQLPIIPWHTIQVYKINGLPLIDYIVKVALELTYTAYDLEPFAKDCGYVGPPFKWDEERRHQLRCELDAIYANLYGVTKEELDYILETFPILKRKDEAKYKEFRTKRMILDYYERYKDMIVKSGI